MSGYIRVNQEGRINGIITENLLEAHKKLSAEITGANVNKLLKLTKHILKRAQNSRDIFIQSFSENDTQRGNNPPK
jgi:hypothetical protein